MHGLGNDFVVIDLVSQSFNLQTHHIKKIANRRFGIGCDQVLIVEPPSRAEIDFRYRIFNGDGQEVEQCGNGARCFARFVQQQRLTGKKTIHVEVATGIIELTVTANKQVIVDMGAPTLKPDDIPFIADNQQTTYALDTSQGTLTVASVSMGNPHCVIQVEDITKAPVDILGPEIEQHPQYPQRVNVGFMQIINRNEIKLRVFERGAGETLACGTGACAAVVAGQEQGLLDEKVVVTLPGGQLTIQRAFNTSPSAHVLMTGPASTVFDGKIQL